MDDTDELHASSTGVESHVLFTVPYFAIAEVELLSYFLKGAIQ
jgi:hypothetical protein